MKNILVLAGLGLALAGCGPTDATGYVEVKRQVAIGPTDSYRLNGQVLEDLKTRTSIVLRQPAGRTKLEFVRAGTALPLCDFDLGKNRIVTATIQVVDGRLVCAKQL